MHTTAGAEILLDNVAAKDAPLVAQLRARGAVILGKANLSEFAGVVTLRPAQGGFTAVGRADRQPARALSDQRLQLGLGGRRGRAAGDGQRRLGDLGLADQPVRLQRRGRHEAQPRPGERGRRRAAGPAQRFARADRPHA